MLRYLLGPWSSKVDSMVSHDHFCWISRGDEVFGGNYLQVIPKIIAAPVLLRLSFQDVRQGLRPTLFVVRVNLVNGIQNLHKDPLGVKELGVNLAALKPYAHHEDLRGDISGCRGLRGVNFAEELMEDPEQRVVVSRAEHLGDIGASHFQVLACHLRRLQGELILVEGILRPIGAYVRGAIVKDDVGLLTLELLLNQVSALLRRNVGLNADHALKGPNRHQVDGYDLRARWHITLSHLRPSAGSSTEIQAYSRLAQEVELLCKLDELEGRSGPIALVLGQVVELVEAVLSLFQFLPHRCRLCTPRLSRPS
mmetsp:Transcript_21317/g.47094  ORF Transcript_21317/g.47094 Transcript_21317/m.47094 type:complete len:310 (+) Transcript_21317:2258-3187(+)